MTTVFALIGRNPTEPDPLPLRGDDGNSAAAEAAPERSGETAEAVTQACPTREAWVEWLLVLLAVAVAVAGWVQLIGNVFR